MMIKRIFLVWLLLITILLLSSCQTNINSKLEPSKLFYVHDKDHTLLNATSWSIFNYGEELYIDSKADNIPNNIQGSQVVVLSIVGDSSQVDSTSIFNTWGIGENNMGILIILFFTKVDDGFTYDS